MPDSGPQQSSRNDSINEGLLSGFGLNKPSGDANPSRPSNNVTLPGLANDSSPSGDNAFGRPPHSGPNMLPTGGPPMRPPFLSDNNRPPYDRGKTDH